MMNLLTACLKTELNWSKNVQEERDAPWQMMMGSMDSDYCVFINIVIWLELNLMTIASAMISPYLFPFTDDITIPLGGQKSKDIAQNIFGQRIFKREEFSAVDTGPLGSYSVSNYAATHVKRCGLAKVEKIFKGSGKGEGE